MALPWPPRPLPTPPPDLDPRFRLRPPIEEDAPALAEAWADGELRRWLEPPAPQLEAARRWIGGEPRRREDAVALDLAIVVGGTLVGEVGFTSFDEPRRACLIGYWLVAEARGTGLAAAAVAVATDWLRTELGRLTTVIAECAPENEASHRVAERAGYQLLAANHGGRRVYVSRPAPSRT